MKALKINETVNVNVIGHLEFKIESTAGQFDSRWLLIYLSLKSGYSPISHYSECDAYVIGFTCLYEFSDYIKAELKLFYQIYR